MATRARAKEHYRNAAGEIIPSVTTILNELNKPALVKWANRLGLQGIDSDKYKDDLADIGTLTHYLIMCRLHEELPNVEEYSPVQVDQAQACYRKFVDWEERNPIKPILVEERFVSEKYQYGGQPDLYALCVRDLLLADFKTNARGVFPEMLYQVAAYARLLAEQGYVISKAVVLRIGRNDPEGFEEHILTRVELDTGFEIFARCLDIHRIKKNQGPICTALN
jgi:uncharacterized protein YdhG (YjbR/CyaY superfamily)